MTHVSLAMREGAPLSRLAVYLPLEDCWTRGTLPAGLRRPSAAHHWELHYQRFPDVTMPFCPTWVTGRTLEGCVTEDGALIALAGNARFEALYLDVDWLDPVSLRRLSALAGSGLRVFVGRRPERPGRGGGEGFDRELSRLLSMDSVRPAREMVRELGRPVLESPLLPEARLRIADDSDLVVFIANPATHGICYPMERGQAVRQGWSGELPLKVSWNGSCVETTVRLEASRSALLRISGGGRRGAVHGEKLPGD